MNLRTSLFLVLFSIGSFPLCAETILWIAPENGLASVAENWNLGRVPTEADDVVLRGAASVASLTWDAGVNGLPTRVASWAQDEAYTNRVVMATARTGSFTNFTITGSATLAGGSWLRPGNTKSDNNFARVWLNVTVGGDLSIGPDFVFNGYNSGYYKQKGYSSAGQTTEGASHGGQGGSSNPYGKGMVYGDYRFPITLGSGAYGSADNYGGGAILLSVGGDFTLHGTVTASAGNNTDAGGPSGGSVWITARTLSGTGSITATGGTCSNRNRGGGGGGRIAIHLTHPEVTFTAFTNAFTGTLLARGSASSNTSTSFTDSPGAAGTIYVETPEENGRGRMLLRNGGWKKSNGTSVTKFNIPGTATIAQGITWDLSELRLETHGRVGIAAGGTLRVPSFTAISGDGSAQNVLRFENGGALLSDVVGETLCVDGYHVEAIGTNSFENILHLSAPHTLTVEGDFTLGGLSLNGRLLPDGDYSAETLGEPVTGSGTLHLVGLQTRTLIFLR